MLKAISRMARQCGEKWGMNDQRTGSRRTRDWAIKPVAALLAISVVLAGLTHARGAVTGYVNNPTGNSVDWSNAVTALGGTVTGNIDFETHPLGTLQSSFYKASHGVTLMGSASMSNVRFGAGPGQPNTGTGPVSPGEGLHSSSRYLYGDDGSPSTLTVSFDTPMLGAGLFVIDNFNPGSQPSTRNPIALEAFTGPNGTGASLGQFDGAQFNFQPNHLYFMGVVSTNTDIQSLVFTHPGLSADEIGIDDIRFAVPEPATMSLLALGGLAMLRRRRR